MVESRYPHDEQVRRRVTQLLYGALPELYRIRDRRSDGSDGDLLRFLRVLAGPLAAVRQNVEELHGDIFVDTCNDWVLPYLADMVGTELVFPDVESNRRDLRRTVEWRRRKGTPQTLEDMADELSGQISVMHEGWKRVQMSQDLNLLRPERVIPDVADARISERSTGPLDDMHHAMDARPITRHAGRYHQKDVTFWTHMTETFPLRHAPAHALEDVGVPFELFAFDMLGTRRALRVRPTRPGDDIGTDRVAPMHFDADPDEYFDRDGRFAVYLGGVPAAMAEEDEESRVAENVLASPALVSSMVEGRILEAPDSRLRHSTTLEVLAVATQADPAAIEPDDVASRLAIEFTSQGHTASPGSADDVDEPFCLLKLEPSAPQSFFPGGVVELVCQGPESARASHDGPAAVEGFLRGALRLRLPERWLEQPTFWWVTTDGSLYDAGNSVADALIALAGLDIDGDRIYLSEDVEPATTGPGAAWPPSVPTSTREQLSQVLPAPGRGPVFFHGGDALTPDADGASLLEADDQSALVFAARHVDGDGHVHYEPMVALEWTGPAPDSGAAWAWVEVAGNGHRAHVDADARFEVLWDGLEAIDADLVVRFESSHASAILPPCEVAYACADGKTVLAYLPELNCGASASPEWKSHLDASPSVRIQADGSTYWESSQTARFSLGQVAPLPESVPLQRWRVVYRNLGAVGCGVPLGETPRDRLEVDPERGLFALSTDSPLPDYPSLTGDPAGQTEFSPSAVTVTYQVGSTGHQGALPAAREPALERKLAHPTRLVCRHGALSEERPESWQSIPRYNSLTSALAAIEAAPAASHEVVQFEDNAHYVEAPAWPGGIERLTLQAAEGRRPLIEIEDDISVDDTVVYDTLEMLGLTLYRADTDDALEPFDLPVCEHLEVHYVTVLGPHTRLVIRLSGDTRRANVVRSILGPVAVSTDGQIDVVDSVVGSEASGIEAGSATGYIDRSTVLGESDVFILDASNSIFVDRIDAADRFEGCIRYSHAPAASKLPRKHRVDHESTLRFVSLDRQRAAYARLSEDCPRSIRAGADDGAEMGVFNRLQTRKRLEALEGRLRESIPAGLRSGFVRID